MSSYGVEACFADTSDVDIELVAMMHASNMRLQLIFLSHAYPLELFFPGSYT